MPVVKQAVKSHARFTPFLRGVIYGLFLAGWTHREIVDELVKSDGSEVSLGGVATAIKMAEAKGGLLWDGLPASSSSAGRPRMTATALDKKIVRLVFKYRGKSVVTARFLRKMVPAARAVSMRTLRRRLGEAGLAWLRRRRKTVVPEEYKIARVAFADWVLARTAATLERWAYTDGMVFYLARSVAEKLDKKRAALGRFVWRQASGADALYEDCVGPSAYWKAQGTPVRIWGLLAAGMLMIYVLPQGEVMNRWWYTWLINAMFKRWLEKAFGHADAFLVQDHERCLWCSEPKQAMREQGLTLLENYPKSSQDLNAIETAWREVRNRLAETEPDSRETRDQFIIRLRNAVAWVNANRGEYLLHQCRNQKDRARDVKKLGGARTGH